MSHVTFHVSEKEEERQEKKSYKVLGLVGGGSVIDGATPSSFLKGSLHNNMYALTLTLSRSTPNSVPLSFGL